MEKKLGQGECWEEEKAPTSHPMVEIMFGKTRHELRDELFPSAVCILQINNSRSHLFANVAPNRVSLTLNSKSQPKKIVTILNNN